ncbi:hypothetical protein M422DRAFT_262101 [Sphaerobolus stellatus SS14]|uniref:Uncharacterized protein n=1 Tax=Sphaerobolus stellatus (strain SS14) TaxID=990650 RepID=A0A0C9VD78_SPHS4|nr:hypothetical protein M422DRAFT_262101 [Sphaerobolus stellatus SS14]
MPVKEKVKGNAVSKSKTRASRNALDPTQILEGTRRCTPSSKAQHNLAKPTKPKGMMKKAAAKNTIKLNEASGVLLTIAEATESSEAPMDISKPESLLQQPDLETTKEGDDEEFAFDEEEDEEDKEDKEDKEGEEDEEEDIIEEEKIAKPITQVKRKRGCPPKNSTPPEVMESEFAENITFRIPEHAGGIPLYHEINMKADTPFVDVLEIIFKKANALAYVKSRRPFILYHLSKDKAADKFGLNTQGEWNVLLKQYRAKLEKKKSNAYAEISFNPTTFLEDLQALLKPSSKVVKKLKATRQLQVNYLKEDVDSSDDGGTNAVLEVNPVTKVAKSVKFIRMEKALNVKLCSCQLCSTNVHCHISKKLDADGKPQHREISFLDFQLWVHEICEKPLLVMVDVPPHIAQFKDFFHDWDGPQPQCHANARLDVPHPEVEPTSVSNVITNIPGLGSGPLPSVAVASHQHHTTPHASSPHTNQ